jgi:hypothetical protein
MANRDVEVFEMRVCVRFLRIVQSGGGEKGNMPEVGLPDQARGNSTIGKGRSLTVALACIAKPLRQVVLKATVSVSAVLAAMPAFAQGADGARIELPFGGGSVGALSAPWARRCFPQAGSFASVRALPMKTRTCVQNSPI